MPGLVQLLLCATLALLLLWGCGNSRTPAPQVAGPAPPDGFRTVSAPAAGATLSIPRSWVLLHPRSRVLLVLATSDDAVVALWRYPARGPVPGTDQELGLARRQLIAAARARDRSLRVIGSTLRRVDGHPAVTLEADEHIGHPLRRVLSTHVWDRGQELVLEEYAAVRFFASTDRTVFSPVLHSLTLSPS